MDLTLERFAADDGADGEVSVRGSGSRGGIAATERIVHAPPGIERIDAAEMVAECGAGTPVDELLAALADVGQTVTLPPGGTVGGALAVGHSDITRLGHGPVRDVLLQTHYVSSAGKVVTAGGPTVKNVSGFDLCRLLVGARGTLGFFGDVLLRTRPLPRCSAWYRSDRDPFELLATLYRPVSILWDGGTTFVRLDGDAADVRTAAGEAELRPLAGGPPPLPGPHRWSLPPASLATTCRGFEPGSFVAEIGVGIVHHTEPPPVRPVDAPTRALHERIKHEFDPAGRMNPGVDLFAP